MNKPSGCSARLIWMSAPGRSLTLCSANPETTRLKLGALKGSKSSSQTSDGRGHSAANSNTLSA